MGELASRAALVTGGSRGIGRAISERLAADGALVAIHYGHDENAARATLEAIQRAGGRGFIVRAELGTDGDVDTLFAKLAEAERPLGGGPDWSRVGARDKRLRTTSGWDD